MKTFSKIELDLQKTIFKRVFELSNNHFSYNQIIKQIKKEFSVKLNKSNLSYWFNHEVKLIGGINQFEAKPSSELAYVIGVLFGDGSIFFHKKKSDYAVRVDAIDKDFVEHFSKCVSKVLNKDKNYAVVSFKQKAMTSVMYSTKARSKKLYYFIKELKEDFEKVKPFAHAFPKEFIQGVADSEGCPVVFARTNFGVRVIVAVSVNKELLEFILILLNKFNIKSNLFLSKKAGMSDSIINGRIITRTKNLYGLQISNFLDIKKYSVEIPFNILRKRKKLFDAIFALEDPSVGSPIDFWLDNYEKRSNQWFVK